MRFRTIQSNGIRPGQSFIEAIPYHCVGVVFESVANTSSLRCLVIGAPFSDIFGCPGRSERGIPTNPTRGRAPAPLGELPNIMVSAASQPSPPKSPNLMKGGHRKGESFASSLCNAISSILPLCSKFSRGFPCDHGELYESQYQNRDSWSAGGKYVNFPCIFHAVYERAQCKIHHDDYFLYELAPPFPQLPAVCLLMAA